MQFISKLLANSAVLLATLGGAGCSLISRHPSGSKGPVESSESSVSRAQYEELLKKYQELKNEKTAEEQDSEEVSTGPRQSVSSPMPEDKMETVDVFESDVVASSPSQGAKAQKKVSPETIEAQVSALQVAIADFKNGQWKRARTSLESFAQSQNHQVAVRAKFYLGEMMFSEKKMQAALPFFENIVEQYSFSGFVLPSLQRLVIIHRQLGQMDVASRYESILTDVFGMDAKHDTSG